MGPQRSQRDDRDPRMTTFDQLEEDLTVMTDLTLTEQELKDLKVDLHGGLYCQHCRQCLPGCREGLPVPDLMRATCTPTATGT